MAIEPGALTDPLVGFRAATRRCKRAIRRGERIFYYPNGRAVYCADDACGGACHREFSDAALAEDCGGLRCRRRP